MTVHSLMLLNLLRSESAWHVERKPSSEQEIRKDGAGRAHAADVDAQAGLRECLMCSVRVIAMFSSRIHAGVGVCGSVVLSEFARRSCEERRACAARHAGQVANATFLMFYNCSDQYCHGLEVCCHRLNTLGKVHLTRATQFRQTTQLSSLFMFENFCSPASG